MHGHRSTAVQVEWLAEAANPRAGSRGRESRSRDRHSPKRECSQPREPSEGAIVSPLHPSSYSAHIPEACCKRVVFARCKDYAGWGCYRPAMNKASSVFTSKESVCQSLFVKTSFVDMFLVYSQAYVFIPKKSFVSQQKTIGICKVLCEADLACCREGRSCDVASWHHTLRS